MFLGSVFVGSFSATFLLDLDFTPIAEAAISVASIAMGVYIAAVSALLGSDYAKKLQTMTNKEDPTKTLLEVLASYFRIAGLTCVELIIVGCLYLLPKVRDTSDCFIANILFRCGSAFSYAVFSINILLIWLILIFLVNSLSKSIRQ